MAKKKTETKTTPVLLDCGTPIDGKKFVGSTFELTKTNKGILYHCYGGYSIFVTSNNVALYETLNDLIENQEDYNALKGKEKEDFELNISAIAYVLNVPLFAFSSADFTFDIATMVVQFLQKTYDEAMSKTLQEETVDEDNAFKEATLGVEAIQNALKSEK